MVRGGSGLRRDTTRSAALTATRVRAGARSSIHTAVQDRESVGEFIVGHDARRQKKPHARRVMAAIIEDQPRAEASADESARGFQRAVTDPERQHRADAI